MKLLVAVDRLSFEPRKVALDFRRRGRRVLSKWAWETRKDAQRRLEVGREVSAPGEAPHLRKRSSLLSRRVLYHVDYLALSAVVGPARVGGTVSGGLAPAALEYGGKSVIRVGRSRGRGRRDGRGRFAGKTAGSAGRAMTVEVKARPFMRPAAAANARRLTDWRSAAGL